MADAELIESSVPLFDVAVRIPPDKRLEDIERLAGEAGLPADRIARLLKVLRSSPSAKVGAAVTQERAQAEKAQFSKAGLLVDITPILSIQALQVGTPDGLEDCPACDKRVAITPTRQCPSCGVYVDKLSADYKLKRKIMEQERSAIEFGQARSAKNAEKNARDALEASMRAKIRAELEKEFGLDKKSKGSAGGVLKGAAMVGLVAIAFFGGKGLSSDGFKLPWSKDAPAGAGAMSANGQQKSPGVAGAAGDGTEVTGGAGTATGDPDIDDPLIQAAGGKRIGAKGLTLEQAVAASQTLAKAVGNNVAERAMNGAGVGKGGPGGAATAAGEAGGPADASTISVPKQTKQVLTAEFATLLAELGQIARSKEVLKALAASVDQADAEAAPALRGATLKSQAWSVQRMDGAQARAAVEDLKAKTLAIKDPAERTQLQGSVAAILSLHPQLSPEISRSFLALGADSLKAVTDTAQVNAALGNLAVSMAEVFSHEAAARASAGIWAKAHAAAAQAEELITKAPDGFAQSRLYAIDYQIKRQMGQPDKAAQSLEAALGLAGKNSNLQERAVWLRNIAQLADAASQEQLQAMTAALQTQLDSKSGPDKAQALTQLSLLYANGGLFGKSGQFRTLAQSTKGLSPADIAVINTDLIVRSDLATARVLQSQGRYSDAEALLQRVSGFLF